MRTPHRLFLLAALAVMAWPVRAPAQIPYAPQDHSAWCAANPKADPVTLAVNCRGRSWCSAHGNDNRIMHQACEPWRSHASPNMPAVKVSAASLDAGRDLTDVETQSFCFDVKDAPDGCGVGGVAASKGIKPDFELLPQGMKTARLAMVAHISLGFFGSTVVKIGIGSGGRGVMSLNWSSGHGRRRAVTIRLNSFEADHLLAALNRSSFWQLPYQDVHEGVSDGEVATVEVSIPGRRNHVTDFIGPPDAVDLSVLVQEIAHIISLHWKDVPGCWC